MAVYNGNVVGYGNGGRWYVQLEVTDGGGNIGTSTTVTYTYRVVFLNSIVDSSNTINWSDPWGSGSANNYAFNGAGTYTIASHTSAAGIQYGGGNSLHFRLYATGMASGGTGPSVVEIDYPLPARQAYIPSPPPIQAVDITATGARIIVYPSRINNGSPVDRYEVYVLTNNAWPGAGGNVVASWAGGTGNVSNLRPATRYYFTARAHNAAGWSGWSDMQVFDTLPAAFVYHGIPWNAIVYVKSKGVWRQATPYVKHNGVWRLA